MKKLMFIIKIYLGYGERLEKLAFFNSKNNIIYF